MKTSRWKALGALALAVVAGGAFVGGVEVQKHEGGTNAGGAANAQQQP